LIKSHVHHYWSGRWALSAPRLAEALPYPCVSVLFEEVDGDRNAEVAGPRTGRVTRVLRGDGHVFGVTFRPATFGAPFVHGALAGFTNRVLPLGDVFGAAGASWAEAVHQAPRLDDRISLTNELLARLLPPLLAEARRFRDLVERMAADPTLLRVEDLCATTGVDERTLQRGFRRYVGVTPKWVLQRFRLIEAVERLKVPRPPSLADLAASLGYADQAHFARDFKRMVGETPRRFVERVHPAPAATPPAQ
jgi:AraC-like DNA-binding protein